MYPQQMIRSVLLTALVASAVACGQQPKAMPPRDSWSGRIAESFLARHPDAATYDSVTVNRKWKYEQGLMLFAVYQMWLHSGDRKYFEFVQKNLEQYVDENGGIRTYKLNDYNLDNIAPGRALIEVFAATQQQRFRAAAEMLRRQLRGQPRTHEGGFWHKKIYPYQMWLDGLYMAEPFYAKYAATFNEPSDFDDIANQFILVAQHTLDPKTGLMFHGWDESKQQRWANRETGCSESFWGRSVGWYTMALVDVLDDFPADHPKKVQLLKILKGISEALLKFQDTRTHLWYQVLDQNSQPGNYIEVSASSMFVYSFAKGSHKGYLEERFLSAAKQAFEAIVDRFVTFDSSGLVNLHGICSSAGLGGTPYRNGSFEYYSSIPQQTNDMKGFGPFLLASIELENGAVQTENGAK